MPNGIGPGGADGRSGQSPVRASIGPLRLALWAALIAGLALRVAVVLDNGPAPRHDLFPGMDEVNYHELAENLNAYGLYAAWTGGFLARSTRSPGYPALLAAAQLLTGGHSWTAPLLNLALDLANLLLVWLLARQLYGKMAAGVAAGLYALFGPVFLYLPLATPEMLSVTLVLLIGLCLALLPGCPWRVLAALGMIYALLIHTRPVFLLLLPVVGIGVWLRLRTRAPAPAPDSAAPSGLGEMGGAISPGLTSWAKDAVPPGLNAGAEKAMRPQSANPSDAGAPPSQDGVAVKSDIRSRSDLWSARLLSRFGSPRYRRLALSAFPVLLALALCLPWGVRNWRHHRAVVPVCVVAGWHLVNRAQTAEELSVKFLTDYIYDPAHANFAEGDYYREGMKLSRELFFREPFRVLGNGFLRVVHGWFLPQSWHRFLQPRAYVRPVFLGQGGFVPLPDAEGMLYLLVALAAAGAAWRWRDWLRVAGEWWRASRVLLLLLLAYAAAHVLGFPLIQYRFTVEPLLLVLGVGLALATWRSTDFRFQITDNRSPMANSGQQSEIPQPKSAIRHRPSAIGHPFRELRRLANLPPAFAAVILLAVLAAWGVRGERREIGYPPDLADLSRSSYDEARERQWQNLGDLPEGTRGVFAGVVKYPRRGLIFPSGAAAARPSAVSSVAMLYVNAHDRRAKNRLAALGIGDCKLNFTGGEVPRDGDAVVVRGQLRTDAYQCLIVEVASWGRLPATNQKGNR